MAAGAVGGIGRPVGDHEVDHRVAQRAPPGLRGVRRELGGRLQRAVQGAQPLAQVHRQPRPQRLTRGVEGGGVGGLARQGELVLAGQAHQQRLEGVGGVRVV